MFKRTESCCSPFAQLSGTFVDWPPKKVSLFLEASLGNRVKLNRQPSPVPHERQIACIGMMAAAWFQLPLAKPLCRVSPQPPVT